MDASIVMPTYNKRAYLEQTLQSLVNQKHAPRFEVVVVDDCSGDDTPALVEALQRDYPLRYLRNPVNMGRSRTRNVGLAACRGDVVIFLDDDRVVCEDFVYQHVQSGGPGKIVLGMRWEAVEDDSDEHLLERFMQVAPSDAVFRGCAAIARGIVNWQRKMHALAQVPQHQPIGSNGLKPDTVALADIKARVEREGIPYRPDGTMGQVPFFDWPIEGGTPLAWMLLATGNLSYWRADVLAAGGFDETFSGWGLEDTELGYRMNRQGRTIVYQPGAENFHLAHPTSPSRFTEMYENWRHFYQKYPHDEAALFILYQLGQMPLATYRSAVTRLSPPRTFSLDDAQRQTLYDICALVDDILQGRDVVLALSPEVVMWNKESNTVALLRPALAPQSPAISLLCVNDGKELTLRFDGRTPLSRIIQTFRGSRYFSSANDLETEITRCTAHLVRLGVLCAVDGREAG